MKIAVWRYGLNFQTHLDSTVGGGWLAASALRALRELGHTVTIVTKVSPATLTWADEHDIQVNPTDDLRSFDGALVLTGPANAMFKGMPGTYVRLASLRKGAIAAYAQWDSALPFQFAPERSPSFTKICAVGWPQLSHLKWHLLTQVSNDIVRSQRSKTQAYNTTPFQYHRCVFELAEWSEPTVTVCAAPYPAVGYFGGDRPGRIAELRRWFANDERIPVHVWGRWSDKSRALFADSPNVEFQGPVAEGRVRELLRSYALTLHLVDFQYVAQDFIAQRFFECAMARLPTFYSRKIQPTLQPYVEAAGLFVDDPTALAHALQSAKSSKLRWPLVEQNEQMVRGVVAALKQYAMKNALSEVYR